MWEFQNNINDIKEIRGKSTVYLGVGAIHKIKDILAVLKAKNISKILLVTGKNSYKVSGAWQVIEPALKTAGIEFVIYDGVTPNPTVEQVDKATEVGKKLGAQAVIAIGGGSPIDAGKSAAILLKYPEQNCTNLYEYNFTPEKAVPIITINLTHGTGTEINRFAVVSILKKDYKPAIAYDCIYPLFSIDDPALMTKLSRKQTLYVSIDALNHVFEAATTKLVNPLSILLAKETIRLVHKYLPIALNNPEDLNARYYLLYASLIAGTAFDNGLLHYTHALEHPLSAVKPDLEHGLGLAILLPAIIKNIYPEKAKIIADILSPIKPGLKGEASEAMTVAIILEDWMRSLGIVEKLEEIGFTGKDVDRLSALAMETPSLGLLLSMAPTESSIDVIKNIYTESLRPLSLQKV